MSKLPSVISMCRKCTSRNTLRTSVFSQCDTQKRDPLSLLSTHQQICTSSSSQSQRRSKSSFGGLRLLSSDQDAVNKVVSDAEKIVGYPTSFLNLRCLLSDELSNVAMQMRKLVGTKHPLLKTARGMVLDGRHNRQMRGLLVMLIAKAAGPNPDKMSPDEEATSGIYNSQRSLAEITEVIHTANLIHKGVVNLELLCVEEQGALSDMAFGNKMAVLSGDYLLASACSGLADLGNPSSKNQINNLCRCYNSVHVIAATAECQVVESVASSIGDMMTAEFTEYTNSCGKPTLPDSCTGFSDWLRQTFLTLGSLLSKSCQAALMLSGHSTHLQDMAFDFGKNLTYSHQLSKDILPFIEKSELNNLSLTSGPVLMYRESVSSEEFSNVKQLWEGGVANHAKIVSVVTAKGIVEVCRDQCRNYRDKAIASLDCFPESDAKTALISMAHVMSEPVH